MIEDVLVSIGLLLGGTLGLLGGVGLLRFPDVLTRLHAATKASSLGLILLLIPSAFLSHSTRGTLEAILVIIFLFFSAPLGSAMLARAVHEDSDTQLVLVKDVASSGLTREWSEPAPGGIAGRLLLGLWLFAVWVGMYGRFEPSVLVGGAFAATVVVLMFPRFSPGRPRGRLRIFQLVRLGVWMVADLWQSTMAVVGAVLRGRVAPGVIAVPLTVRTRVGAAFVMNTLSFSPGTIAFDVVGDQMMLHTLDLDHEKRVRDGARQVQRLVIRAFGTPEERRLVDG